MDKEKAIEYITRTDWRLSRLGLERMYALMEQMGNPQNKLRYVHIAGTNGKSSISCMTAEVLHAAGYTTGLYTSPYVNRFNERMQVNGIPISDEELAEVTEYVRNFAEKMEDHPTEFELVTAIAFEWFVRKGCDVVALEVGLGGRLDATNVIQAPDVAVITTIDYDHTDILGHTLPEIAAEKAGIIKPGADVVLYPQLPRVQEVFETVCKAQNARLTHVKLDSLSVEEQTLDGQKFTYKGEAFCTPLLGAYQPKNAATVLIAMQQLQKHGFHLPLQAQQQGLAQARWPARFELMHRAPEVIVDGGHNPQGVAALLEGLDLYFKDRKAIFIVGVMADKDYPEMFGRLLPYAEHIVCVTPNNERSLPASELAAFIRSLGFEAVTAATSVKQGVQKAMEMVRADGLVCAFGSLYMAGEIRSCFLM